MSLQNDLLTLIEELESPNMIQTVVVGTDFIYLRAHNATSTDDTLLLPFDPSIVENPLSFLEKRVFGCMEELVVAPKWKNEPTVTQYLKKAKEGTIRLAYFESTEDILDLAEALDSGASLEDLGIAPIREGGLNLSVFPLQPEHYEWDKVVGLPYFSSLLSPEGDNTSHQENAIEGVLGSNTEEVVETPETTSPPEEEPSLTVDEEQVIRTYRTLYGDALETILYNYSLMFTAAYQLKRPYGIATIENGHPAVVSIKGTQRVQAPADGQLLYGPLVRQTLNASGLKVLQTRNPWDIASLVLTGTTRDGSESVTPSDRLYFPNKMLEYAYGLDKPKDTEGGRTNYPRHSSAESWSKYSRTVRASLEDVMQALILSVYRHLKKENPELRLDDTSLRNTITDSINRLKDAFLTCVLVAEVVQVGGSLGLFKLKILDPYGLDVSKNIATEVAQEAFSLQNSVKSLSRPVVTDNNSPYYSAHSFEGDSKMVAAMPLFAYKAADAILKSGRELSYRQMILGIDINDNILQNGAGKVNMTPKITHYTCARSRAGKGVEGLSKLANAIKSGKPVFYIDNKPDMASMVLALCERAFAVNGGNAQPGSEKTGSNIQNLFLEKDYNQWGNPNLVPSFLTDRSTGLFDSATSYSQLGNIYYLRAVLLVMSMIDARVRLKDKVSHLFLDNEGNDSGLVAFFDEFNNLNDSLRAQLGSYYKKEFANINYYNKEKEINKARNEGVEENKLPKHDKPAPSPSAYWMTTLIDKLNSSAQRISMGKNAGYGDTENALTDIYIIGQELPDIVGVGADLTQYYPERMAATNKAKESTLKPGYYPLAPLVAPFGQDILIGYSDANYLNQKVGYASDKLNEQNRMFAYINDFTESSRKDILSANEEFAKSVPVYYKPFLILPDSSYKKYYVRNSMGFLDKAGLNVEDVITQNANVDQDDNPITGSPYDIEFIGGGSTHISSGVTLNDAVGLKGYLNFIGVSNDDIERNLAKSGEIAQGFMELIGYKGTWREFIMDMRPEYLFSIDDIHTSIKEGVPLANVTTTSSKEFYYIYRDLFTTSSAYDPEASSDENSQHTSDLAEEFGSFTKEEQEEALNPEQSTTYITPQFGSVEQEEIHKDDHLMDDINLNKEQNTYENHQGMSFSEDEKLQDMSLKDILNLSDDKKAQVYRTLLQALQGTPTMQEPNEPTMSYGSRGVVYDSQGRAYRLDTSQVDRTSSAYDDILFDQEMAALGGTPDISYKALVRTVTNKALATAKSQGGFSSISVIGGSLSVNNVVIGLNIPQELLLGVESTVAQDIKEGRLAPYFNWKLLPRTRVTSLNIDSSRFVFSQISPAMGYGANFDMLTFFEDVRSLQKFTVGDQNYMREDVREVAKEGGFQSDPLYQPRTAERGYRLSQAWLAQRRVNTWNRAVDTWKRQDIGTFRKVLYSTANATASAATTTTAVSGWAGRKLFRTLSKGARDLKDLLDEANTNRK